MRDRGGDLGKYRRGEGREREADEGGRRLVVSEPIEKDSEDSQRGAGHVDTARVVVVADRQSDEIECGQRVTVFGFKSGQIGSSVGYVGAVAAVLSDHQVPAQSVQCLGGIRVAAGEARGKKRRTQNTRVARSFGGPDQTFRKG